MSIEIIDFPAGGYYLKDQKDFESKIKALFSAPNEFLIVRPKGPVMGIKEPNGDALSDFGMTTKYLITNTSENAALFDYWFKQLMGEAPNLPEVAYRSRQLKSVQLNSALFAGVKIKAPEYGKIIVKPNVNAVMGYQGKSYLLFTRVG